MGADSSAENTPNAPKSICPICLPKPKNSGFQWKKASLGVRSLCFLPYLKTFLHQATEHGITEGVFCCNICPKAVFLLKYHYKKHMVEKHAIELDEKDN